MGPRSAYSVQQKCPDARQTVRPPAAADTHTLAHTLASTLGPGRGALAAWVPRRGGSGALVPARPHCLPTPLPSSARRYEKLSRLPRVKGIKRYNLLDAPTSTLKRPPVDTLSEARMTLRSAAVRRGDNGAPTRLQQSITYITKKARLGHHIFRISPLYLPCISPSSPRRRRARTRRSRSCPTAARRARARC